jgi:hypothetical protein
MSEAIQQIVSHIRRADSDVIIGPIRLGHDFTELAGAWYFITISADADGYARLDAIQAEERSLTEEMRDHVMYGLIGGKPIVIHDMDDELSMMQMAEALWPSARTTMLRERVEQEMGGW